MIYVRNASPENYQGFVAYSATAPGQWCAASGFDSTYTSLPYCVHPVASSYQNLTTISGLLVASGHPVQGLDKFAFPVFRFPGDDVEWQEMSVSGYTISGGTQVLGLIGKGIVVEDHQLYYTIGTGVWRASTTYVGMPLMINATGYLTAHDGGGAAVVATLEEVDTTGGIVVYKTV